MHGGEHRLPPGPPRRRRRPPREGPYRLRGDGTQRRPRPATLRIPDRHSTRAGEPRVLPAVREGNGLPLRLSSDRVPLRNPRAGPAAFDALFDLLQSEGVRVERLSPSDAKTVEPQLEVSDYAAVVYDPNAGYADPIATAHGFAAAAAVEGAKSFAGHAVAALATRTGHVTGIKLRGGKSLACERVVVAAGNWTPRLVANAGPRLPVRFVRGDVAILRRPVDFGPPPKIHFDFYGNTYSRPEAEKDTLCGYMDTDPRKTARNHELGETLPSATVRHLRGRLAKRFPRMAEAQPRGGWSGAYDVTPDSYPILDRFGPDGLFVAVGFSGHGFKLSPEVGRLLAEFVATGRRPEALEALQASRFEEGRPVRPDAPFPRRGRRLP